MPRLSTATIPLELLQYCLATLEQPTVGITNLGADATEDPTLAPPGRVLLEELLMSLQQCESDLGVYPTSPFALLGCCRLVLHPALFRPLPPNTRHRLERDKRVVVNQLSRNLV
jgi:hypothetical protein